MMKGLLLVGVALGIVGYAWMSGGDPNLYSMSQAEAYAKLSSAKLPARSGSLANGTSASGNGSDKVYWNGQATHCEADITPEGNKSRIMAFCNGGDASSGAAAGMLSGMQRRSLIEHIDATLTGRAFEPGKAQGSTAARWPADPRQPDGSMAGAVGGAFKMQSEMMKMQRDYEKNGSSASRYTPPPTTGDATRPTTVLN